MFFRNWGQESGKEAGEWGRDEIRNLYGELVPYSSMGGSASGIFSRASGNTTATRGDGEGGRYILDASTVVPTGIQNVPQHVCQPLCLYLGRPA